VVGAVLREAEARSGTSVVVTFDPHPQTVIAPERPPQILTTLQEKAMRVEALGVDVLAVVPFTTELRSLSPEAFVREYLVGRLGMAAAVVGYDHGFGRDRSGGLETVERLGREYGFAVHSMPPIIVEDEPVSSTRIRRALLDGDLGRATRLLGSGYPIAGRVVEGDGRGRELGFPTANLEVEESGKLLPPDGVYAGWVRRSEASSTAAVVNLGCRPTFNGRHRSIEAHLLDFSGELYGEALVVELVERIRDERKFESPAALMDQIQSDCQTASDVLSDEEKTLVRR
jgi:riboflavin kinase/FMN adenylyltransferase